MYYFEKDYIMRMIHGIAQMLAYLYFGRKEDEKSGLMSMMGENCREDHDYLRQMIDSGQINTAENRLFDLLDHAGWDSKQNTALILAFYEYLNGKDDITLARADFSREEIIRGMEDALKKVGMEIPEYLRIE